MEKLGYSRDTQKLIYAIMNDISNFFTGQDAGRVAYNIDLEQTKKQLKERFLEVYDMQPLKSPLAFFSKYLEKNKDKTVGEIEKELKETFIKALQSTLIENKTFSLALNTLTQNQANDFIKWLLETCIYYDVPLKMDIENLADQYTKAYHYVCLKNRICCICGKEHGVLHHYDNVARVGGYKFDDGRVLRVMCLCEEHHTEVHAIGAKNFSSKYHVVGIYLDDRQIRELKKVYKGHFQAFKEE
ncbi:putative HNHc nuclease [Fusobacterium nucleatum]|nr:putative HNHc nuclease [Fusobacterium nucleatum]WDF24609.1 putative HNHc nuclease [Fusobacterium nucleatum]